MTTKVKRTNVVNGQYDKRRFCWLLDRKSRRMISSSKTSPWISSVSVWLTGTVCPSRLYEKTSGKVPRDATLDDRELHWWRTMPTATVEGSITCPFTVILCKILCIGKRSRRSQFHHRWGDRMPSQLESRCFITEDIFCCRCHCWTMRRAIKVRQEVAETPPLKPLRAAWNVARSAHEPLAIL